MKSILFSALVLGILTTFSVRAADPATTNKAAVADDKVVAKVNGDTITRSELNAAVQGLRMQFAQQGRTIPPAELGKFERDVLEEMVSRELLLQQAKKQELKGLDSEVDKEMSGIEEQVGGKEALAGKLKEAGFSLEDYRQRVKENLMVQKTVRNVVDEKVKVSEKDIEEFYNQNKEHAKRPEMAKVRHILIRVPPQASEAERAAKKTQIEAIRDQLKKGGDFAKLAKEHSEDPGSKERGGDLGEFPAGVMVPEFDAVAFSLEPGKISDVVSTQFGFHVLEVISRTEGKDLTLPELHDDIEERLKQEKGASVARDYVTDLRKSAKVEILLPASTEPAPKE